MQRRRNAVDKLCPSLPGGVTEEIEFILDNLELRIFTPSGDSPKGSILYFHGFLVDNKVISRELLHSGETTYFGKSSV